MSAELMYAIVIIVLAAILFGTLVLVRRRVGAKMEPSTAQGELKFRDCYDLCAHEPGKPTSQSFSSMCTTGGSM